MKKNLASKYALTLEEEDAKFQSVLTNVIEQSLIATLGKAGADAMYLRLEQDYRLKKEEIPEDLERFHTCMMRIFGSGALLIEKCIMEKVHTRLFHEDNDLMLEKDEGKLNFIDYIQNLKSAYSSKNEKQHH